MKNQNGQRAGILGIVSGIVLALAGVGTGIYLGMVKPALEAGEPVIIPVRFIVASVVLLTSVGLFAAYKLSRKSGLPPGNHW